MTAPAWGGQLPAAIRAGNSGATPSRHISTTNIASSGPPPARQQIHRPAKQAHDHGTFKDEESSGSPLILSVLLDDALHKHLTSLRTKHFPSHRNYLAGHITLFHALPSSHLDAVSTKLQELADTKSAFPVKVGEPVLRGSDAKKAVFLPLFAKNLVSFRASLLEHFQNELHMPMTDQDKQQKFWPHATVVNKVPPEKAEQVFEELKRTGEAGEVNKGHVQGVELWYYKGGPWEHIETYRFR
jgi:2'-5' RNA ligase